NELTTVMLLLFMCNSVVIISGMVALKSWLKHGKIRKFFRILHSVNQSGGIIENREILRKLTRRCIRITNFIFTRDGYSCSRTEETENLERG
ncbi:hypothetical protein PMAYCL1PPCAC_05552, partial [Pristionchus mayeri]